MTLKVRTVEIKLTCSVDGEELFNHELKMVSSWSHDTIKTALAARKLLTNHQIGRQELDLLEKANR